MLLLLAALSGCTEKSALSGGGQDLQVPPDAAPPDLVAPDDLVPAPDLANPLGIGVPCPNGAGCAVGLTCGGSRLDPSLPADGYCTKGCANDADCGAGAFCGAPLGQLGRLCYLRCAPGGACAAAHQVCSRIVGGFVDLGQEACIPGNAQAKDGAACSSFGDCNRNQACLDNPLDWPNGSCTTIGCTVGDDTSCAPGGGSSCFAAGAIRACLPTCNVDLDCRAGEGYRCLQPPGFPQKACLAPNPLGVNCANAGECNGGSPWSCINDATLPRGYCSIVGCDPMTNGGCPSNGLCIPVSTTTICLKTCAVDGECAPGTTCKPIVGAKACVP